LQGEVATIEKELQALPSRLGELSTSVVSEASSRSAELRQELLARFRADLEPFAASLDGVKVALRGFPARDEIPNLVAQSVQPAEKRVADALEQLRTEHDILEEDGQELVRRIRTYRPGTIEELQQRLDELRKEHDERRAELAKAHVRIDELERDNAHLKESTGAVDRAELERIRQKIAQEREAVESAKQLQAERDELRSQVAEYQKLEARYRAVQEGRERDIQLEEQVRELDHRCRAMESDLAETRQEGRAKQHQLDQVLKAHATLQVRNQELVDAAARHEAEHQILLEKAAGLEAAVAEHEKEKAELARQRGELLAKRVEHERGLEERTRRLEEQARSFMEAQSGQHEQRMTLLEEEHRRRQAALEQQVRAALVDDYERQLRELKQQLEYVGSEHGKTVAETNRLRALVSTLQEAQARWEGERHARELELRKHQNVIADLEQQQVRCRQDLESAKAAQREGLEARDRAFAEKDEALALRIEERRRAAREAEEALASAESRVEGVVARLADVERQYHDEFELLKGLQEERRRLQEPADKGVRTRSMHAPLFRPEDDAQRAQALETTDEMRWLDNLARRIHEAEFVFPRRLLEAFHTSLKITHWSPLTVLAGMSGTGKSALSRLYAHFGGLRHHMVPVQPNWDSPHDLFGFFNHIDGLYKATPLLRALTQSQRPASEGGFADGLLLVALDEMNLARVEYYASELLSRWEARRDGAQNAATEAIQLEVGYGEYEPVALARNVLWVGTMNEDETTLSLSDKVLERGNLITFPRPRELQRRERLDLGPPGPWLPAKVFADWTTCPSVLPEKVRDHLKNALEEINSGLRLVQRSVSHRILQAIENYVANHPRVRASITAGAVDGPWQRAFADQLVQKVMPKLRGLDTRLPDGKRCLAILERVLSDATPELVPDFNEARRPQQFLWSSAAYLEHEQDAP
jgi:chromosome segregation ATPase